jgi:Kef-type K+ transport system membrane component KefB
MTMGLEVMILLAAAMLGIVLAKRLGQSAIVGEILIGVLIGPTLLGWVHYDEPVKVLAELGAIFMLFTIGLESDFREIYKPKNAVIALFGVVIPFILGWWVSKLFGYSGIEALFVGTALTATSIAITARILHERGLLSTPVAKTIIGAAVVDDILGLIVLSIITSMSGDITVSAMSGHIAVAIGFVIAAVLLVKPVNKLVTWVTVTFKKHSEHVGLFAAMVVAFGYAGVAEYIGLSSIVGAFLAGVTLEAFQSKTLREGSYYFETLFSAIFFVSLGVVADFSQFGSAILFALALIVAAVISKFVGCFIAAKLFGHKTKEAVTIGFGMVPRGEVAMIVGLLGLTAGIVSQQVYGAIILMAFITTVLTPVLLNWSLAKPGTSRS